jgi:hypothetical protein
VGTTDSITSVLDQVIAPAEVSEELETEESEEIVDEQIEDEEEYEDEDTEEFESDEEDDDEDDVDEIDDAGPEEPELLTVKVDGKEVQVTLDDLKRGYSGQSYVQKGMQEAAAAKKEADELKVSLLTEQQKIAQLYQQMQSGQGMPTQPAAPPIDLLNDDPIGYMEQKARYDVAMGEYSKQMTGLKSVADKQAVAEQESFNAHVAKEAEALQKSIPDFANPEKAQDLWGGLSAGGQEHYGFTDEEVRGISDHRAVRLLNDALKYRKLMASKSKVNRKAKGAKPVVKPGGKKVGTGKRKAQERRKAQLKNTGSIKDAVSLIMET